MWPLVETVSIDWIGVLCTLSVLTTTGLVGYFFREKARHALRDM